MKVRTKLLSIAIAFLVLTSILSTLPRHVKAQGTPSASDPTNDLYYYMSGSSAPTWGVIDIVYAEISKVNSTHIKLLTRTDQAIPLTNQWQAFFWLLDTGISTAPYGVTTDANDLNVAYVVGVIWYANGVLDIVVDNVTSGSGTSVHEEQAQDRPEQYFSGNTCSIAIPLSWIGNPDSIRCVAVSGDGAGGSSQRHDKAPNTGHITLDILPPEPPWWTQWWFWTIIALGAIAVVLALTTVHYRKKTSVSRETSDVRSKTTQKANKVCPRCGANLPADSKFCGKCGTSLE